MVTRRWQGSSPGFELHAVSVERNGVVVVDITSCFKAEDVLQLNTLGTAVDIG